MKLNGREYVMISKPQTCIAANLNGVTVSEGELFNIAPPPHGNHFSIFPQKTFFFKCWK